ncbi:hypothetical protein [Vibrio sagamiensis]|uniref:Hydroxylamine reductase n=1 Tax=Vibrio sagamiensis NBRC 104589 TaxID=1219064 RepID=A0A511QFV6_9VIBR|nr:hypothetical protein [Vibrio sagamiensis]PNQ54258.1 hypothetical protein C1141_16815 [Vibrio agarivorans]GEM76194.1 hypothetical protein VSA01S_23060 [Vibrio sagamiensis NBRC 104589]
MNRIIVIALATITGLLTLTFSLLIAIPVAIAAIITGKRIEKKIKDVQETYEFDTSKNEAIEGEYEEVHR